jgi:AbrB family looped-hinge helix DNA binding protein
MRRKKLTAVVAERGQITIPKSVRDGAGIAPGTILQFELSNDKIVMSKHSITDPVAAVYGCLKGLVRYKTTGQFMRDIRGTVQ